MECSQQMPEEYSLLLGPHDSPSGFSPNFASLQAASQSHLVRDFVQPADGSFATILHCDNPVDSLNLESEMLTNYGFRCQFPDNKKQKRLSNTRRKCRQVLCSTCTIFLPYLAGLGELDSTR